MIKQLIAASVFSAGVLLAGAATAQAENRAPIRGVSSAPAWHQRGEAVGDMYTDALNTLYAHGFHAVHDLSMQDGTVQAIAVTPTGQAPTSRWYPAPTGSRPAEK